MAFRTIKGKHLLLRIMIGESDKLKGELLYMVILKKARELGLAGCTISRGMAGFGAASVIHSEYPPEFTHDLPIIIETVDTPAHTEKFLKAVQPLLKGALVTEEEVRVRHYHHGLRAPK